MLLGKIHNDPSNEMDILDKIKLCNTWHLNVYQMNLLTQQQE